MLTALRPLRIAVLCSGRAPGLLPLLNRDARRGAAYDVVCCLTSEETFVEQPGVERRGIPVVSHPVAGFCQRRGVTRFDRLVRPDYDLATVAILERYHPDLVLLDGYLLLLTGPMLEAYAGRLLNVHHSDLAVRNRDGSVRYPGLRAVRDAILAGESETRASAHVVTAALDDGPVLLRSWPFPVAPVAAWAREHGAADLLKSAIWAHQEWMLREAWAPMMAAALELAALGIQGPRGAIDHAATGRWTLSRDGSVTPDGVMLEAV
jgi:folate-dependent phosphoribosylglycinamide formyltransferase PurN